MGNYEKTVRALVLELAEMAEMPRGTVMPILFPIVANTFSFDSYEQYRSSPLRYPQGFDESPDWSPKAGRQNDSSAQLSAARRPNPRPPLPEYHADTARLMNEIKRGRRAYMNWN